MSKVFDVLMEKVLEAEQEAFEAMSEVKTKYGFSQAGDIYDKIKAFRMGLEDELYPSERMVDVEALVLRNEGQEVRV